MINKLEFQPGPSDDREVREHADPIMAILARLHDDPAIADMVALRQSRPDLRDAAVKAEAHRNAYGWSVSQDGVGALERIALLTISGAHAMIVAIFPVGNLDDVDAKVAMQPTRKWLESWQGRAPVTSFEAASSTRPSIRANSLYRRGQTSANGRVPSTLGPSTGSTSTPR